MKNFLSWALRIVIAVILGQTLFFKFTGAQESVDLFTKLGAEPVGRYATGILELIAVVLVLVPRSVALGAVLSFGLMSGALFSHLTTLGFEGPMGVLGLMAAVSWLAAGGLLAMHWTQLPFVERWVGAPRTA